jgi:RHH-type proline utilization regulon transcriptional repressor/proline dehydrogenase/delta 1-pyrroline-5-carboxylate dehydrogenase
MIANAKKRAAGLMVKRSDRFLNYYSDGVSRDRDWMTGPCRCRSGTVVVVTPWNFLCDSAGGILAALAAGNAVIFKPAPETVLTAWLLANHIWDMVSPRDLLQFGSRQRDRPGLVTHEQVGAVILTGSRATARRFLFGGRISI